LIVTASYPIRVRAVGHLHEAEDDSQAWPELHDAIRAARKAYQRSGAPPDFAALGSNTKCDALRCKAPDNFAFIGRRDTVAPADCVVAAVE
jgi:hypothetical protein